MKFAQLKVQDNDKALEVDVTVKTAKVTTNQAFVWSVANVAHDLVGKLEAMYQEKEKRNED